MSTHTWTECSRLKIDCPICGRRDRCKVSSDGTRERVLCFRATSGPGLVKVCKNGVCGLFDVNLRDGKAIPKTKAAKPKPKLPPSEIAKIVKNCRLAKSDRRLAREADRIGVTARSLLRLSIGYSPQHGAFTFPLYGADRKPIGIRIRASDGAKWCWPGGAGDGLLIPADYDPQPVPYLGYRDQLAAHADEPYLLIASPEGPTDTAACLDYGFMAIGRPNNRCGDLHLFNLLRAGPKQDVIVIADADEPTYSREGIPSWPGWEGAVSVCETIAPACGRLRFCYPPAGVKDMREAKRKGINLAAVMQVLQAAEVVECRVSGVYRHRWITRQRKAIERRKAAEVKVAA